MAQTKTHAIKNIRSSITGSRELTSEKLKETTSANVAVADHVLKISARIEKLSENEKKFFNDLLSEIKKIPESTADLQRQQKAIYENLIKASAIIRKEAGKETDEEKKKDLHALLEEMKKRGETIEKDFSRAPKTFKEKLAKQQFGGDPNEVAEKGYFSTMFAQAKREWGGKSTPSFEERVDAEQMVAGIEQIPSKSLKEKTKENAKGSNILERSLKALLSEVTIIRKITEGSLKYDARLKGSPYYQESGDGTKKSISKEMAKTAGVGLFTKNELGEKLGLSKSELKKKENNLAALEEKAADRGIIDLQKKKEKSDFSFLTKNAEKSREDWNEYSKSAKAQGSITPGSNVADNMNTQLEEKQLDALEEIKKDIDTVADVVEKQNDTNENLERSTAIDTDPSDEQRFRTSGSDEETQKEVFAKPTPSTQNQNVGDGFLGLGFLRNIGSKGLDLLKRGGRAAMRGGASMMGAMGTTVGAASTAAVGSTVVGGLAGGMYLGDKFFNKSVEDGGSGNLKDFYDYNVKAKSSKEEAAEKNADLVAQQKGFANFEEMKAHNRKKQQEMALLSHVEKTKNTVAKTIENQTPEKQEGPKQNITNVTNNNYNNPSSNNKEKPLPVPVIRTNDTSFIRYQDKRMTRVL